MSRDCRPHCLSASFSRSSVTRTPRAGHSATPIRSRRANGRRDAFQAQPEQEDLQNLADGLTLQLLYPQLPTCDECRRFNIDLKTGKKSTRAGQPSLREPGSPLPCASCPKSSIEDPRPRPDRELNGRNQQAYAHYRLCQVDTTGLLPRDAITLRNAALIRLVEEQTARINHLNESPASLLAAILLGGKR